MKIFLDNISEAPRKGKARSFTFYLDAIKSLKMDREFSRLEAICTDGEIRPKYPYQWIAKSTMVVGDDDPFEGIADNPLEALHNLWKEMKNFEPELEEEI
jgi:hypothetical protein